MQPIQEVIKTYVDKVFFISVQLSRNHKCQGLSHDLSHDASASSRREIAEKLFYFLSKLAFNPNPIVNTFFGISGKHELQSLAESLGVNANCRNVNTSAWNAFALSIGIDNQKS